MTIHSSAAVHRETYQEESPDKPNAEIQATQRVLHALFGPPEARSFAIRLWNGLVEMPEHDSPSFTLVLQHPGALCRMLLRPSELSLAEAYISGDADVRVT